MGGLDNALLMSPRRSVISVSAREERSSISVLAACAGALFSSRTVFAMISARWLNLGTEAGVLATFVCSMVLVVMASLATVGNRKYSPRGTYRAPTFRWVMVYAAFSGCSLFWSASASPASSALYWSGIVLDIVLVALMFRGCEPERAVHSLIKGFVVGTCALAAIAWAMPVSADLRLGDPDYFNTNQIGNLCALTILMCAWLASREDGMWKGIPFLLGATLFRSLSKATLVAFIVCQAYRLVLDRGMSRKRKALLVSCALALTICFWGSLDAYYRVYTTNENQVETLTGRTTIWAWTLDAGLNKPWFGNGFDAMWRVMPPFGGDLFEARHAENELLQQFFAYGVCGLLLLAGVYGSLYLRIRSLPRGSERSILTSFLIYVIVRGFAEAEPFDLLLPLWLTTALALLVQGRQLRANAGIRTQHDRVKCAPVEAS